jgi:hypothetical protein
MRSWLLVPLAAALTALSLGGPVAIADPAPSAADRLFDEGRALMTAGKPAEACPKFEASLKLDPAAAGTMLNLGLCYEQTGKPRSALVWFRRAQARASEANLMVQEKAAKEHTRTLAARVPILTLSFAAAPPADVQVTLDGATVPSTDWARVEVDPGSHVLEVTAPDATPWRKAVEVEATGSQTIEVGALEAAPDPAVGARHRGKVLTVVGGGVLALSLGYDLIERSHYNSVKATNPSSANASATRVRWIGTGVGAVGIAVAAVGVYGWLTAHPRSSGEAEHARVVPLVGGDQVGVAFVGGF